MRVCIPHCTPLLVVREEDFPQCGTRATPYACHPALWRDLGFCWVLPILVGFVCFAGYEEAVLSSGDNLQPVGLGADTRGWQGSRGSRTHSGGPMEKGLWDL